MHSRKPLIDCAPFLPFPTIDIFDMLAHFSWAPEVTDFNPGLEHKSPRQTFREYKIGDERLGRYLKKGGVRGEVKTHTSTRARGVKSL